MLRNLLLFLLFPVVAAGSVFPEKLQQDFSPLDAVVVLATPSQVLLDCDEASGVGVSDLFALLSPGETIVHPTSGEVLGTNQSVSGWLRVAAVRNGYSEATWLAGSRPVPAGVKISRFREAEALMVDGSGRSVALYPQLQRALPHLRWLGYFPGGSVLPPTTERPRLLFVVNQNVLEVREERSGLLRQYPLALSGSEVTVEKPKLMPESDWNGPAYSGVARGLEVADLDGDGRNETIVATQHGIEIGRFTGKDYQKLVEYELSLSQGLLSVDAFDSDDDGRMELWLTAHRDADLDSLVLLWNGEDRIKLIADHLNLWLRVLTLPETGRALYAQGMAGEDFNGPIMKIALQEEKILLSPAPLPATLPLYGMARLGTVEEPVTVQLTPYDNLVVRAADGEVLLESDQPYGGSEAYFTRPDPQFFGNGSEGRHVYPPPRFDVVGRNQFFAPANLGSRTFKRQRLFKESRLDLLQWDGGLLRPVVTGRVEQGHLVDYRYADIDNDGVKEIVSLLVTARPGFSSKGRFQIVVNETILPE